MFHPIRILTIVMLLVAGGASSAPATGNYVQIDLPRGVRIDLPRNWSVLSKNQTITLDSSVEARFDATRLGTSELPFAANLYNDRRETVGIVNVRYYPSQDITQREVAGISAQEVAEVDAAMRGEMIATATKLPWKVLSWSGTMRQTINGVTALVTDYRRSSLSGGSPFRVRLVRVFAGPRSFTLTVSYREAEAFLLEPIADRIIRSLRMS